MQGAPASLGAEQQRIHDAVLAREEDLSRTAHSVTFSASDIGMAIKKLRLNSSPGLDGITAEHLRYGASDELCSILAEVYSLIFTHGVVPKIFETGVIVPILKKPTLDTSDPANFRPITIGSTLGKLAELLVALEHTPCRTQFGFRRGRSTSQAIACISDLATAVNSNGSPLYLCALDAEKCFDCIWHSGLFFKLMEYLSPASWLFLYRWYRRMKARVRWNGDVSDDFVVTRGTRQGGIISPALFNVFIDGLLDELQQSGIGVRLGTCVYNSVAYADDITLFSSTIPGLQRLINRCYEYSQEWLFRYGIKKTKCLTIGKCPFPEPSWTLNGQLIANVKELEVLGTIFTSDGDFGAHVEKRMRSCRKAFFGLDGARLLSPSLKPALKAHLWSSCPRAALMYGCEALPLKATDLGRMNSLQGSLVKQALRIGKRSHHSALLTALGIPSVQHSSETQCLRLLHSIMRQDSPARDICLWSDHLPLPLLQEQGRSGSARSTSNPRGDQRCSRGRMALWTPSNSCCAMNSF